MKAKRVSSPLRTAIIYSVFGVLWIPTSDTLLGYFIPHTSEYYPLAQTIKGWLFVLVGAALLYMILNADAKKLKKKKGKISKIRHVSATWWNACPPLPIFHW